MEHNLWYDEDTKVIHLQFTRDYLTTDVEDIRKNMKELVKDKPYRQMCIQISKTAKVENRETREKSNQLLKEFEISHVAFIGGSAANRMIAKVMLKTGAIKIQGDFFKTIEEGVNWLISKR
ncbi:hypothetical protein [uncultured Draconibacterium sp.]|uniref:DUF7793 family protein n=1 Tax=uncultured Draconibacterium sp. TaxID=1573823 RepID=UPI002AA877FF|nr:hypothetical protein [uncultured Draconibacterium sp.]